MANKTLNEKVYMQVAGLDIGNGCVKGTIGSNAGGETEIDIQSVAAKNYNAGIGEIRTPLSEVESRIGDIFNYMDATFESSCLDEPGRYFMGKHAMESGNYQLIFEVGVGQQRKSEQSLSAILTLGCIAGKALQDAWNATHVLPEVINTDVRVATLALPIQEYRRYRETYASSYKKGTHKVTIHTFETDVVVNITFANVQVLAEGASATYAIRAGGVDMANKLIQNANEASDQHIELTGEDIYGARATMGIDIGEGTTNLPIYDSQGNFNADASTSNNNGYGVVLDSATILLRDKGFNFGNRKDLQIYLMYTNNQKFKKAQYAEVQAIVDNCIENFAQQIADNYQQNMKAYNTQIMVVYVYGGGSTAMKYYLFQAIVNKTRKLNGGIDAQPILYFDNPEARVLNRDGLYIAAKRILELMGESLN